MSIAQKLQTIAGNQETVYKAGALNTWNEILDYGRRSAFNSAFQHWGSIFVRPTEKVVPTDVSSGNQTFESCPNLKKVEKKYFDFSQKLKGANNQQGWYFTFSGCPSLEEIQDIGMQADFGYINTFMWCVKLKKIEAIRSDENTKWSKAFQACTILRHLRVEGTIAQNGFDLSASPMVTSESLYSVFKACNKDVTAEPVTITLNERCYDNTEDTMDRLERLGAKEYVFENASTITEIQLDHNDFEYFHVFLIPQSDMGDKSGPMRYGDETGNIYNEITREVEGHIDYSTGKITLDRPIAEAHSLIVEYSVKNPYTKALSLGYNVAIA